MHGAHDVAAAGCFERRAGPEHRSLRRTEEPDRQLGGERHRLDPTDRPEHEVPERGVGEAELARAGDEPTRPELVADDVAPGDGEVGADVGAHVGGAGELLLDHPVHVVEVGHGTAGLLAGHRRDPSERLAGGCCAQGGAMPSDRLNQPMPLEQIVIVGASLAGLRAAETLRQKQFAGGVTVVGSEPHRPYDRPPLSKKLLSGEWEPDRIHLRQPDSFDDLDVNWELGTPAQRLDLIGRTLELADGRRLDFDGMIVATGATPKRIGDHAAHDHVFVLRSLDDALAVRERLLVGGRRVVVIGAGFIGLEVAATAAQLGNEVVVLEGAPAPLIRGLGAEMGAVIGAMHTAKGIDLRCDVAVVGFDDAGVLTRPMAEPDVAPVLVPADVIVVGVGVTPATGWLEGSGVELRDGIVCDENLRVRLAADADPTASTATLFAAGDVVRWPNLLLGHEMRVEHWTNAAEQGAHAASNLLAVANGEELTPYAAVPFFWSDQFDHRIQFLGHAMPGDEVRVVAGSIEEGKFVALYGADGRLHGALGVNAPRWLMPIRKLLLASTPWDEAVDAAAPIA